MLFNTQKNDLLQLDIKQLNPLTLAFVGDAVYELYVRTYILARKSQLSPHKMHLEAIKYVKAHSQSEIIKKLQEELTEEEIYYFKKGRNAKSGTVPKNADVQEYRFATGFECLIGYLYVTGRIERLEYILEKVICL